MSTRPTKQQKTRADQSVLPANSTTDNTSYLFTKNQKKHAASVKQYLNGAIDVDKQQITKIFEEKIQGRTLALDNPKKTIDDKDEIKREKRIKKRKKHTLSRKKRQILESSLQTEQSKLIYDEFVPLNNLWKDYISDFLGNSNSEQTAPGRLVKADFHGASVIVSMSSNPTLVGISGIIIQETMNTFKIVTKDNQSKVVPKIRSQFSINIGSQIFTIYGDHFCFRSGDRTVRKYKYKPFTTL